MKTAADEDAEGLNLQLWKEHKLQGRMASLGLRVTKREISLD